MRTARFLPAQIWTIAQAESGNAVFIRPEGSDVALPVYISEGDMQAILVELTHILAPRPMVHELLLSAIDSLHGKLDRVEIYGIRSGSYLCRIILLQEGKEIRLESRPSDILCLSARMDCPVHIDDAVLARNGVPVSQVSTVKPAIADQPGMNGQPPLSSFLKKELETAIEAEDYERAAQIRDRIAEITREEAGSA
jgi:uncharacterized protein